MMFSGGIWGVSALLDFPLLDAAGKGCYLGSRSPRLGGCILFEGECYLGRFYCLQPNQIPFSFLTDQDAGHTTYFLENCSAHPPPPEPAKSAKAFKFSSSKGFKSKLFFEVKFLSENDSCSHRFLGGSTFRSWRRRWRAVQRCMRRWTRVCAVTPAHYSRPGGRSTASSPRTLNDHPSDTPVLCCILCALLGAGKMNVKLLYYLSHGFVPCFVKKWSAVACEWMSLPTERSLCPGGQHPKTRSVTKSDMLHKHFFALPPCGPGGPHPDYFMWVSHYFLLGFKQKRFVCTIVQKSKPTTC